MSEWKIKPRLIYRGHSNYDEYKLVPIIFREIQSSPSTTGTMYSQLEFNIISDFISEARRFESNIADNDIQSWLELAQHFGVPTRLLDFTQNPLIALYFACKSKSEQTSAVWFVNEATYNKKFWNIDGLQLQIGSQNVINTIISEEIVNQRFDGRDGLFNYKNPWIYKPIYRQDRMNLQSSIFMLWGSIRADLKHFMEDNNYMDLSSTNKPEDGIIGAIQIRI